MGTSAGRGADGFRQRGQQVTRLETFVDAAFAFSLTLLVIVFDDLPDSVAELRAALRQVPAFAFCFAMLAMFWAAHNRWSRRFGLEDARSALLSLGMVFVVMIIIRSRRGGGGGSGFGGGGIWIGGGGGWSDGGGGWSSSDSGWSGGGGSFGGGGASGDW